MKRLIMDFLLLLPLLLVSVTLPANTLAQTYYVSKSGNDYNPGTEAQPWATIQKAANTVQPGDTVLVSEGTYPEVVDCSGADGTEDGKIQFLANGKVVVYGWYLQRPYYVIKGFTITGQTVPNYSGSIYLKETANHCEIRNNIILHDPSVKNVYGIHCYWREGDSCNSGPVGVIISENQINEPSFHALSIAGRNHIIEKNIFQCTTGWDAIRMFACNTTVSSNRFDWSNQVRNSNHSDIIQSFADNHDSSRNIVFEKNYVIGGPGLQICMLEDDDEDGKISNWVFRNNIFYKVSLAANAYAPQTHFYNNLFYQCTRNLGHVILFGSESRKGHCTDCSAYNNIFYECGSNPADPNYGWYLVFPGLNISADYNLVIGTGTVKTTFNESHGVNNGRASIFVDAENGDFRLSKDSPAIGAGKNLYSLFQDDFAGNQRQPEGPWDIGPYILFLVFFNPYLFLGPIRTAPESIKETGAIGFLQ